MPELTTSDIMSAARNDAAGTFTLQNPHEGLSKSFEIKHLGYDAYVEFISLTRPILTSLGNALDVDTRGGEFNLQFNPMNVDYAALIDVAGKELPKMAWLCCRQSDPKITIDEVKRLAGRPQELLKVVLLQIKHNNMVQEFADFFPQIVGLLQEMLPAAQEAAAPIPTTAPTE